LVMSLGFMLSMGLHWCVSLPPCQSRLTRKGGADLISALASLAYPLTLPARRGL
jgi:hypothetical protein